MPPEVVEIEPVERLPSALNLQPRGKSRHESLQFVVPGSARQADSFGKWLETKPRLLIVDEPTRSVDVGAKAAVHQILRDLAGAGLAILVVSSDLPEVLTIADRVLVMREGAIVREFAGAEATEESIMLAATGQEANAA